MSASRTLLSRGHRSEMTRHHHSVGQAAATTPARPVNRPLLGPHRPWARQIVKTPNKANIGRAALKLIVKFAIDTRIHHCAAVPFTDRMARWQATGYWRWRWNTARRDSAERDTGSRHMWLAGHRQ